MKDLFDLLSDKQKGSNTDNKETKAKRHRKIHSSEKDISPLNVKKKQPLGKKQKKTKEKIHTLSTENHYNENDFSYHSDNIVCYSVSELSRLLRNEIEHKFDFVKIRGELGRVSQPASGHVYFDIKDESSVIAGIIWKNKANNFRHIIEQGLEVIATGSLTIFAPQSRYQITIEHIEPAGKGALMALLEQRRLKLQKQGLFDEDCKKSLPFLPKKIGIITSLQGAVIKDILHRLRERFPSHVIVYPAMMQGEQTASQIVAGIQYFNSLQKNEQPDIIIIARGGGSIEDLWPFNEEIIVYAAKESVIPIISAIGHETDWCLLDYVADYRAPTPTAAAEKSVPVRQNLYQHVSQQHNQLMRAIYVIYNQKKQQHKFLAKSLFSPQKRLAQDRQRLDYCFLNFDSVYRRIIENHKKEIQELQNHLSLKNLQNSIDFYRYKLDIVADKIHTLFIFYIKKLKENLINKDQEFKHLGYPHILKRGFVFISSQEDQKIIKSDKDIKENQIVKLHFYESQATAKILQKISKK